MIHGAVQSLTDIAKVNDDHTLRPLLHHLGRLDEELPPVSRQLGVVRMKQRIHSIQKLQCKEAGSAASSVIINAKLWCPS